MEEPSDPNNRMHTAYAGPSHQALQPRRYAEASHALTTPGEALEGSAGLPPPLTGHARFNMMPNQQPLFISANMYDASEDQQLLFIQAMNQIQAEDNANGYDAFESWLEDY